MQQQILSAAQQALVTIGVAVFTMLSAIGIGFLNSLKDKAMKSVENMQRDAEQRDLDRASYQLDRIAETVVMSIEQEEKQKILKDMEDGKIDNSELNQLRQLAVSRILNQLTPKLKRILTDGYGDLNAFTADLVSRKVFELKRAETRGKSKPTPKKKPAKRQDKPVKSNDKKLSNK